jgi:cell division protein FtsW (lipid II flippase)
MTVITDRTAWTRVLLVYGLLSLAAVALGCVVCALSGVPAGSWSRNLVAWVAGLGLAVALARFAGSRAAAALLVLALLIVLAGFFGSPQQGVHRWLDLGPLHINVAFIVLPVAVVALSWTGERLWVWGPALALQALLVVQPDASQAAALAAAMTVVALRSSSPVWLRGGVPAIALALAVAAWGRPDPLSPVPEVEEIVALAAGLSPLLAILAVIVITGASIAPAVAAPRSSAARTAGLALSAYMLATAAATLFGAFPMPLLGIGMSPVVGFWLGVGLLGAMLSRMPAPSPASGS